jgi:hypothetical protein
MVEVAVRVRAVEETAGGVVDAKYQARLGRRGAELRVRPLPSLVRHFPVRKEPLGVDGGGPDPIRSITPGNERGL